MIKCIIRTVVNAAEKRKMNRLMAELESHVQIIREKDKNLAEKDKIIADRDRLISDLAEGRTRIRGSTNLDDIINDPKWLKGMTGLTPEEFAWILKRFAEQVKKEKSAPRFSENVNEPGNTCVLAVRHVLLLALHRERRNPVQWESAAIAGVDQSTISRYLVFAINVMPNVLPTADSIAEAIRKQRTLEDAKQFMPGKDGGELWIDGTHARVERPSENQEEMYSGKKKTHAYNVQITSNRDNLIVDISDVESGSVHDMTMLRSNPPKLGRWTDAMKNPDTPDGEKTTINTDKGYPNIEKEYPGVVSRQPRKKPPNKSLTESDKEYNRRIGKRRIKVEHAINRLKNFRRISAVYDDTKDSFRKDIVVVSGLVNLHIMLRTARYRKLLGTICP